MSWRNAARRSVQQDDRKMNTENRNGTPRRIVVALDASSASSPNLESVVRLAAELRAEILGLFVEETELYDMAALPMARAVPSHGVGETALDEAIMGRALRARSASLRRTLEQLSSRWEVTATFEVARGGIAEQLSARTRAEDLLTLGAGGEALTVRLSPLLAEFLRQAPCAVLHLRRGTPATASTVVIDNGQERLLAAGLRMARAFRSPLSVIIPPQPEAPARNEKIAEWLAQNHARANIITLDSAAAEHPADALPNLHPGTVIYDRTSQAARKLGASLGARCSSLAL